MSREALFAAVRRGDVASAQQAIDALQAEGDELAQALRQGEWTDEEGNTLVGIAAAAGHVEVIDLLQRTGMDLTRPNHPEGFTPLDIAAAHGRLAVLTRLHDAQQDPDVRNAMGRTAAQHAARTRQMEVVEFMIERGVPMPRATDAWWGRDPAMFDVFQQRVNRAAVSVCIRHLEAGGVEWANEATRLQSLPTLQPFALSGNCRPVEVPGGDPRNPYVVTAVDFNRLLVSGKARHPLTRKPITEAMLKEFRSPGGGYAEGHAPTLRAIERVCDVYLAGGESQELAQRGLMAYEALSALPVASAEVARGHYSNFMHRLPPLSGRASCCTVS
jgi:ankyrin repeat protein